MYQPYGAPTNIGFGRVSDNGLNPNPLPDGYNQKPLLDPHGRLYVMLPGVDPDVNPFQINQAFSGAAFVTQFDAYNGTSQLIGVAGFNSHTSDVLYAQIHDHTASPLAPTDVPSIAIPVPPMGTFSYGFPMTFSSGIVIAFSTTPLIFTAPAAHYMHCSVFSYGT